MEVYARVKPAFVVVGKEGSTADGPGFVQALWENANVHFGEIAHLAKRDENGALAGMWGAMTDVSRAFLPWEDGFSKGLYLAGVEAVDGAAAPEGWTAWTIPGYEYLCVKNERPESFAEGLEHLREHGMPLAGAVQEFTDPQSGQGYLYFPVRKMRTGSRSL